VLDRRGVVGALDDHVGLGKARLDVAMAHLDVLEQVAFRAALMHQRRLRRAGVDRVAGDRQRLVGHIDQGQRFPGDGGGLGGDQRHRVAQVAHFVPHRAEHRPVQVYQAVSVLAGDIGGGQDGVHAGQHPRPRRVDGQDAGVGVGGAQRRAVEHPGEGVVVGVLRPAGHTVGDPRHRLADADVRQRLADGRLGGRQVALPAQGAGRRMDGADDAGVAGAAAVGVLERDADVVVGRVRVFGQQGGGGHQQAGRAEAALHRAVVDERGLKRVQALERSPFARLRNAGRQAFDRLDGAPGHLANRRQA